MTNNTEHSSVFASHSHSNGKQHDNTISQPVADSTLKNDREDLRALSLILDEPEVKTATSWYH